MLKYIDNTIRNTGSQYIKFGKRNGVANFKGSEHFDCMKLFVLGNIEKILERYNKLIADNIVGNNVEILDYKF